MLACLVPRLRRGAGFAVLVLTLAAAAGCGDDDGPSEPPGNNSRTVSTDNGTTLFVNANLTVPAGATVTFNLTSLHDANFENDAIEDFAFGGSGTRTFNTPGTYRYRCSAHSTNFTSGMVGTITVQ